jgi:hypothetical protein
MPGYGFLNRRKEVSGNAGLSDIPESTEAHTGLDEFGIGVSRQENDLRNGARCRQSPAGFYAVEYRHRYIRYDDVGLKTSGGFEQTLAVRNASNNFTSCCHQAFHYLQEWPMVIRQEYSYLAQWVRLSNARREKACCAIPKGRK